MFTHTERACALVLHTLDFLIIAAPFGSVDSLLLLFELPRRFCALTERLCLSCSPQAFRERLEPKLSSLAFLSSVLLYPLLFTLVIEISKHIKQILLITIAYFVVMCYNGLKVLNKDSVNLPVRCA